MSQNIFKMQDHILVYLIVTCQSEVLPLQQYALCSVCTQFVFHCLWHRCQNVCSTMQEPRIYYCWGTDTHTVYNLWWIL